MKIQWLRILLIAQIVVVLVLTFGFGANEAFWQLKNDMSTSAAVGAFTLLLYLPELIVKLSRWIGKVRTGRAAFRFGTSDMLAVMAYVAFAVAFWKGFLLTLLLPMPLLAIAFPVRWLMRKIRGAQGSPH